MRRPLAAAAVLLSAGLLASGCSDDGVDGGPGASPSVSSTSTSTADASPSATQDGPAPTSSDGSSPGVGEPSATEGAPTPDPGAPATVPPVPLDAAGDFGSGVTARITDRQAVELTAQGPGEVSGPGLQVQVELTNATAAAVDLSAVTVSLDYGGQEASGFDGPPAAPVGGELAPGASASGVWVFGVPADQRADVTISVSYSAALPIVLFTGDASS